MTTAVQSQRDVPNVLEVQNVTVRFGGLIAVASLNLVVPHQAIVGLVGPNGAGKSTSFDVISGVTRPRTGRVLLSGTDVTRRSVDNRARAGIARTFQHPEIFTALTIRENVTVAHRMRYSRSRLWSDLLTGAGFRRRNRGEDEVVDHVLEQVGLIDNAHESAVGLPLGRARRLEIARSIALGPRIILMDEPTAGLDSRETEMLSGVLRTLVAERRLSLLLVEHDVGLVLGLSSYVYVLDFGKQIAEGTPAEIRESDIVKASYFGEGEQ